MTKSKKSSEISAWPVEDRPREKLLKKDPFIITHPLWKKALNQMLDMGIRVEQQAFAKHDLNFVLDKYLPQKLKKPNLFLP